MTDNLPVLKELNGRKLLYVDGKPTLLLGIQWECELCYTKEAMDPFFPEAEKLGLNMASLLLYWNEVEQREGEFHFEMLDHRIEMCRKHNLKMVLVWFGAYKNTCLAYAPDFVKGDRKRFPRLVGRRGELLQNATCPSSDEIRQADLRALTRIFEHLRDTDAEHTVVLFQMENEIGYYGTDRCYCPVCEESFNASGFGEKYGWRANEAFGAKCLAEYVEGQSKACKEIYPLPVYINVPLDNYQKRDQSGFTNFAAAPIRRVLDIYTERLEAVDLIAPDIYQPGYRDWHDICKTYAEIPGNPLFIAECATGPGSRLEKNIFYSIGEFAAMGFDPWSISQSFPKKETRPLVSAVDGSWSEEAHEFRNSVMAIRSAMIPIIEAQNTENLHTFVEEDGDTGVLLRIDEDFYVEITYDSTCGEGRGFVIRRSENELVFTGCHFSARCVHRDGFHMGYQKLERGEFRGESWVNHANVRREGAGLPVFVGVSNSRFHREKDARLPPFPEEPHSSAPFHIWEYGTVRAVVDR